MVSEAFVVWMVANTMWPVSAAVKAICTTHIGSYESINLAYKALTDYAAANRLETFTPSREVYIKGPGMIFKGNPNKFITELIIPIK